MSMQPQSPDEVPGPAHPPSGTVPAPGAPGTSGWVVLTALAGILLLVLGTFHLTQGLGGLLTEERFLLGDEELLGGLSTTTWSWLHLVVGVMFIGAGVLVFAGKGWARAVGVVVSLLSAAAALSLLSEHPAWAIAVVALDGLVIVALTVHGAEIRAGQGSV